MIDTDLLDLINSGDAWVFVGSGVSVDSGLPSWASLVTLTLGRLISKDKEKIEKDMRFQKGLETSDFAQCFQRMQDIAGQTVVTDVVRQMILDNTREPGALTKLLADWPAAGYLTTNYDDLIESALQVHNLLGLVDIGNQPDEVRKVSGDVRNIVWHIHGSARQPNAKSRLVIGSEDYEHLYLETSELQQQLKSFLTQRRLIFIGHGLRDPEIMRILRIAGRYTIPERPIYAFLGSRHSEGDEAEFQELRDRYNIEVKRYSIIGDSHRDLRDLLGIYSSMVVRRSVNYGQRRYTAPSYDPDATGLLIYNTLVLKDPHGLQNETLRALVSARTLSVTRQREPITVDDLISAVGRMPDVDSKQHQLQVEIDSIIAQFEGENLIEVDGEGHERVIRLTASGQSFVAERAGVANRIRDQFRASLASRVSEHITTRDAATGEVADAAMAFFEDCIEKRSLGVAMALDTPDPMAQEFQVVALLQTLPEFFDLLSDEEAARALVKVVQSVLSAPSEAEAKFCGLLLQARLGVHLLGMDQSALKARVEALRDMVFVIDSTSLIPLIAVSGTGHKAAMELTRRIAQVGATAITTGNLLEEVREHAAYAARTARASGGATGTGVLDNLMGRGGQRPNVFLSGFVEEYAAGSILATDFATYMRRKCGFDSGMPSPEECSRVVRRYDVVGVELADLSEFGQEDQEMIEQSKVQIEERRRQSSSYRHDRQVRAEAEVLFLVQQLRDKRRAIEGKTYSGAFFVSYSRFIDQLQAEGLPVTMRQNVLLQWLGTVAPFEESELPVLMDGLLWELSERGIDFVNRRKLRAAFSGTIAAAKEDYRDILEQHKVLIATEWGVNPEFAFQEPIDDLDVATFLSRHAQQTIDKQRRELDRERAAQQKSLSSEKLSESERSQFEKLKSQKAMRVKKNRRRARGKSANGKKKK